MGGEPLPRPVVQEGPRVVVAVRRRRRRGRGGGEGVAEVEQEGRCPKHRGENRNQTCRVRHEHVQVIRDPSSRLGSFSFPFSFVSFRSLCLPSFLSLPSAAPVSLECLQTPARPPGRALRHLILHLRDLFFLDSYLTTRTSLSLTRSAAMALELDPFSLSPSLVSLLLLFPSLLLFFSLSSFF